MKAKLLVFCDVILMVVKQAKTKGKRWQGKEARGVSSKFVQHHTNSQQL